MRHPLRVPRLLVILLLPASLATALAWADAPELSAESQRASRLQQNRGLIRALVENGLSLASEEDPIQRAVYCNGMVEQFASAIRSAADGLDAPRTIELGRHLRELLDRGVAGNLGEARRMTPDGSADEKKLHEVRDHTALLVGQLEERLQLALDNEPHAEMRQTLEAVQHGRSQVEKVLQRKSDPSR